MQILFVTVESHGDIQQMCTQPLYPGQGLSWNWGVEIPGNTGHKTVINLGWGTSAL